MPEEDEKKFTQADLDRHIADRLAREKTKYADYDDLKAKAEKFDAQEAENKTETQKANDRASAAERERDEAKTNALRLEIAAEKGVKPRYLSGGTKEELEASADEYLKDHPPAEGDDPPTRVAPGKPAENLSGGGDPTLTERNAETNPAKLAESVPRY